MKATHIAINMEDGTAYVQRLPPETASEDPLSRKEEVIIKQFNDNKSFREENARLKKWKLVAENYIEWLPKPFLHAISYVTNQEFIDKLKEEEEG